MTDPKRSEAAPHRLVVIGGGVAGLDIATHLANWRSGKHQLAMTLIDREIAYVWKPMLHTIAAGTSEAGMQETVFAAQARSHGFRYELGKAAGIDRARRDVTLAPLRIDGEEIVAARTIAHDILVFAVGSGANDFGTSGVAEHCARIDSRSEAIAFNTRLRIERARSGQLLVGPTLAALADPHTFALGDCARPACRAATRPCGPPRKRRAGIRAISADICPR